MKVQTEATINGKVVTHRVTIGNLEFYDASGDDVYIVDGDTNEVIIKLTTGMGQGCGYIDEIIDMRGEN
jgi:hypothetical protein